MQILEREYLRERKKEEEKERRKALCLFFFPFSLISVWRNVIFAEFPPVLLPSPSSCINLAIRDFYIRNDKLRVNLDLSWAFHAREERKPRSQFSSELRSTSSWSASFAAIHGPRATDIRRRCDLQLRVNARQDKRNLQREFLSLFPLSPSPSIRPIEAVTCDSVRINCHPQAQGNKTDSRRHVT